MKKNKINGGWAAAITGWVISSIIFPFLPEIIKAVIYGSPLNLFGYPLMEYTATIGLWSVIFLSVWIPAGFKSSKIFKEKGIQSAGKYVITVFFILLFILSIIFQFFWNS
jgi:hypothetical protein